jgi:sensor histidine kinase YesM
MKPFYNNVVFRLAAPPLFGIVIYLLILMFFDSVAMLADNFFSREVLFIIGLTFLFFEVNRLLIVLLNRILPANGSLTLRMLIQFLIAQGLTITLVSQVLHLYFINIEGFSTIRTELLTFNGLYIFATFFYHLYFFSQLFLHRRNDELIRTERIKKENLELRLEEYKNQINPDFLFHTLEILLYELHRDRKKADELIGQLAAVYRYQLDNRENELVAIDKELAQIEILNTIFTHRFPGSIHINNEIKSRTDAQLVPGTLQALFENAVLNNMVSEDLPLTFTISMNDHHFVVRHNLNERILETPKTSNRLQHLSNGYKHLTGKEIEQHKEKSHHFYKLPCIRVEEE